MTELAAPPGEPDDLVRGIAGLAPVRDHGTALDRGWLDGADEKLRVLLERSSVRGAVRRLDVLDGLRKTVVRLELWQLHGAGPDGVPPRLRVRGLRGYEAEHAELEARLRTELGYAAPAASIPAAALRALGGDPDSLGSKVSVPLAADQRADAAAAAVLRALDAVIWANLDGVVEDLDPEFLHDLRVSVRRSRSVQRQLKGVFPGEELAPMRAEFKWLQNLTGELRDLDVQLEEPAELRGWVGREHAADLGPLAHVLAEQRAAVQSEVARALRGRRVEHLRRDWGALLEELVELPLEGRPRPAESIAVLAGERIWKVYRRMVHAGRRIAPESPDAELHDLRKRGKELRYLLELFGAHLAEEAVVGPLVKALKALQDTLGRHQDRHVQIERLRRLGPELVARDGGDRALIAVGVALRALREDALDARAEFAERFDRFAASDVRRSVRKAFAVP